MGGQCRSSCEGQRAVGGTSHWIRRASGRRSGRGKELTEALISVPLCYSREEAREWRSKLSLGGSIFSLLLVFLVFIFLKLSLPVTVTWEWAPSPYLNLQVVSWYFLPVSCWRRGVSVTWWAPDGPEYLSCLVSSGVSAEIRGDQSSAFSRTEYDNRSRDTWYDLVLSVPVFSFDYSLYWNMSGDFCGLLLLPAVRSFRLKSTCKYYFLPPCILCPFAQCEIAFVWFPVPLQYVLDWTSCGEMKMYCFVVFSNCWKISHTNLEYLVSPWCAEQLGNLKGKDVLNPIGQASVTVDLPALHIHVYVWLAYPFFPFLLLTKTTAALTDQCHLTEWCLKWICSGSRGSCSL